MPQECLTPEGRLWEQEPGLHDPSPARLEEARIRETPLEAIATKCDEERTLHLRLGRSGALSPGRNAPWGPTPARCGRSPSSPGWGSRCVSSR